MAEWKEHRRISVMFEEYIRSSSKSVIFIARCLLYSATLVIEWSNSVNRKHTVDFTLKVEIIGMLIQTLACSGHSWNCCPSQITVYVTMSHYTVYVIEQVRYGCFCHG